VPTTQNLPPGHDCGECSSPSQYVPGEHCTHDKFDELEVLKPGRHIQRANPERQAGTAKFEQPAAGNIDLLQNPKKILD
jgi:hypothetical protein